MKVRIGNYLGFGSVETIPRVEVCEGIDEYCFNTGYLDGYDSLAMIDECITMDLTVHFFRYSGE